MEKERKEPPPAPRYRPGGGLRVPGFVVPLLGAGAGWVAGGLLGAIFGGVVGFLIWRSR